MESTVVDARAATKAADEILGAPVDGDVIIPTGWHDDEMRECGRPTAVYNPVEYPAASIRMRVVNASRLWVSVLHSDIGQHALVADVGPNRSCDFMAWFGHEFVVAAPLFLATPTNGWDKRRYVHVMKFRAHFDPSSRIVSITCPSLEEIVVPHLQDEAACTTRKSNVVTAREFACNIASLNWFEPATLDCGIGRARWTCRRYRDYHRMRMSRHQPGLVPHYSSKGFRVLEQSLEEACPEAWSMIQAHMRREVGTSCEQAENWKDNYTNINHYEVPTTLTPLTKEVKDLLWKGIKPVLASWSGVPESNLQEMSIFGVRRYWRGAVLRSHVDRGDVLIISAIINVAQSDDCGDQPWWLELYDHDEQVHYVNTRPGTVVLYESASTRHARPYPLHGSWYANMFVHTMPVGYEFEYEEAIPSEPLE